MIANRNRAIVLRRTNYGEADRVLQLLTPDGKISVIAKGVRREKSRLASGIELFAICEIVITKGKGDLAILTSARLVHYYRHIIEDYDRMQFAYFAIKNISKASENIEGSDCYDILAETLAGLDAKSIQIEMVQTWFYLRHARLMGYELSLQFDVDGKKIVKEENYRYDVSEKGLRQVNNGELTSDHIKLLRLVAVKPLKILAQIGGVDSILTDCVVVATEHAAV